MSKNDPSAPIPPENCPDQELHGLDPGEILARGLNTVRFSGTFGAWVPPEPEDLAALLPQYHIEAMLGHGGMGAVYKGSQPDLDRPVAIKLLPAELSADEQFVSRFKREARTLARLHHHGIVAIYDFGQTSDGHLYFVMEYVDGTDLRRVLKGPGLNPEQALELVGQICEALQAAHKQGVIHRDIKPANILLTTDGSVKLADFGLARPLSEEDTAGLTGSHQVMGTPDYMSPEQRSGHSDHRTDIYALGVTLYEMLTGKCPRGMFVPPSRKVQVDIRIDEVVIKALQEEPDLRYQQASEMKSDVDHIRTSAVKPAAPAPPPIVPPQGVQLKSASKPASPSPLALLYALGVIALSVGLGFLFWNRSGQQAPANPQTTTKLETVEASSSPASSPIDKTNLLKDASFEEGADVWTFNQFSPAGEWTIDSSQSREGHPSLRFTCGAPNDMDFMQDVWVKPNTLYRLGGWIKTKDVTLSEVRKPSEPVVNIGATICVNGGYEFTRSIIGTNGWAHVSMTFNSGSRTELQVGPRLGYYFSGVTGTAWFSDLYLREEEVEPSSVPSSANGAVSSPSPAADHPEFTTTATNGHVTITGYSGPGGQVDIPGTINGLPVVSIGGEAFRGCKSLTGVTIPDSVSEIGLWAFHNCSSLARVIIPASVTSMDQAFSGCASLTSIAVSPQNPAYSSVDGILLNKDQTTVIEYPAGRAGGYTIPDSVTSIGEIGDRGGELLFDGCDKLTNVTIPNSVTRILDGVFRDCTNLALITVSAQNSVYSSVDGVLFNKNQTRLIAYPADKAGSRYPIPGSVTSIGNFSFRHSRNLTGVSIPNGVTSLDDWAFNDCKGLAGVTFPSSVTNIGQEAFRGCGSLTSAVFTGNAPTMGKAVFDGAASDFKVSYSNGATGFSSPTWKDSSGDAYPAVVNSAPNPATSLTESSAQPSPQSPASAPDPMAWALAKKEHWPAEVTLTQPITFPVLLNGASSGTVMAPAGTIAKVINLQAGHLTIKWLDNTKTVPIDETDLMKRAGDKMAREANAQVPAFKLLSMDDVANEDWGLGPPTTTGTTKLGGIPFLLNGRTCITQNHDAPDRPATVELQVDQERPRAIYLLIEGNWMGHAGSKIGEIDLQFSDHDHYQIDIIAWETLREGWLYAEDDVLPVPKQPNVTLTNVYTRDDLRGGRPAKEHTDMLKIEIPPQYWAKFLSKIVIRDTSLETVHDIDPSIQVMGATVELAGAESAQTDGAGDAKNSAAQAFVPVDLSKVANAKWECIMAPPTGHITLGGVPFYLLAGDKSVLMTAGIDGPDRPTNINIPVDVSRPKVVHVLITGSYVRSEFTGKPVGQIVFQFDSGKKFTYPIKAGISIREWWGGANAEIPKNCDFTNVWAENQSRGGSAAQAWIDMLSIPIPAEYQSSHLTGITIDDTSEETVQSPDPALVIMGMTIMKGGSATATRALQGLQQSPAAVTPTPPKVFGNGPAVTLPPEMAGRGNRGGYGEKDTSEQAVLRALRWLQTHQNADGTWGSDRFRGGFTGLALLCFLGHGETPQKSHEFGAVVTNAINALVTEGNRNHGCFSFGNGFNDQNSAFEHGICTCALCEAYTMTKDERLAPLVREAVGYIIQGQRPDGGWAYNYDITPGDSDIGPKSDTSVSGWQIQALMAARLTGLTGMNFTVLPVLDSASKNIDRVFTPRDGSFGDRRAGDHDYKLTGVGVLSKLICLGHPDHTVHEGLNNIVSKDLKYDGRDCSLYAWYYDTQACFQAQGGPWDWWNARFQDQLTSSQSTDGSWPQAGGDEIGGFNYPEGETVTRGSERFTTWSMMYPGSDVPIYRTTLCCLMLEVFYRYLPTSDEGM